MQLYLLYPRNEKYLKGKYKYPVNVGYPEEDLDSLVSAIILALGFLVFMFLIPKPLSWLSNRLSSEDALLSSESVTVQGRIINRYIDEDGGGTTYHVIFEYVANDRRYERRQQVGKSEYSRYEPGLIVDIEYSPSRPSVARLAGTALAFLPPEFLVFSLMSILISGLLFVILAYRRLRWRAQLARGKLLKGKLLELSAKKYEDSDGYKNISTTAHVAFRAPDGRVVRGERSRTEYGDKLPTLPAKDTLASFYVAIFYMDDRNWEVL